MSWQGKCFKCNEFGTMEEVPIVQAAGALAGAAATGAKGFRAAKAATGNTARPLREIVERVETASRTPTDIGEFDRVLGGGFVPGGVILLAGAPGCGKSTLSLLVASQMANQGKRVLYISGEETASQIASRAVRMELNEAQEGSADNLHLLAEGNLQNALQQVDDVRPDILIIDSVQTLLSANSEGSVGSITQVKEVATDVTNLAKRLNIPTILIGHVTKDGAIAGPRVVEHLVDVVLFFEANEDSPLRVLRAVKNRYGSTDEIGCFQHVTEGLEAVDDPSGFFTDEHEEGTSGFATTITMEGRRALPVEIQALATPTRLPNPRKVTNGIEQTRVLMMQAILDRHLNSRLYDQDVYVSTTGGLRLQDPPTDLAVVAALLSSKEEIALPKEAIFIGEVSLTGEIRSPRDRKRRVMEASRLGFTKIYTSWKGKDEPNVIPVPNVITLFNELNKLSRRN